MKHGTRTAYLHHRCRCDACRGANTAWSRVVRERDPEHAAEITRASQRKQHYGLTRADFAALVLKQEGLCAICQTPLDFQVSRRVHIDHDHRTGKVRGILCNHCNRGLGGFLDSPPALRSAANYLEIHSGV